VPLWTRQVPLWTRQVPLWTRQIRRSEGITYDEVSSREWLPHDDRNPDDGDVPHQRADDRDA
jgi:hypothetical protein